MLILHETNSRVPSNGQRTTTHVPLGTVISCPRWPPRSLGLDFTPCYKKAPPNSRDCRDWTVDGTPVLQSTRVRLARPNVYWTLVPVLKGNEKENVPPGPAFGSARKPTRR